MSKKYSLKSQIANKVLNPSSNQNPISNLIGI